MTLHIEKQYPRLWSINSGKVMVVTDLHGDWKTYQSCRDRFINLHQKGDVDGIIFTGDLIHSNLESIPDKSLEIVLDFLQLQAAYNDSAIYLCGNHELPHIYGFGLAKGKKEFTPQFEASLSQSSHRSEIIGLFMSLPFYLRTAAGVTITHAGATPTMLDARVAIKVFSWSHEAFLAKANALLIEMGIEAMRKAYAKLNGVETYGELAQHYLAVTKEDDPRYDDLLRGLFVTMDPDFKYLRSALFTKCEIEFGKSAYLDVVTKMLQVLSKGYWPQRVIVAGHINVLDGYQSVGDSHFRLASGSHARPLEARKYLLLDTAQEVVKVDDLERSLYSI